MANGVFTIVELTPGDPDLVDVGERFDWTADSKPVSVFTGTSGGGARACPLKPWRMGLTQHQVRTDYPGAQLPSRQIMGPRYKTQTLRGYWDDRYNGAGYAEAELQRFEAMVGRGSTCRFQYGTQVFEGVITDFDPDWRAAWRVEYSFTIDIDRRVGATPATRTRVPATPDDPSTSLDQFDFATQAMLDADDVSPRTAVAGTLADDVTNLLVGSVNVRQSLAATIDQRAVSPPENPVDGFTRIATQFRAAADAASSLLDLLTDVRADTDMAVMTAMSVLDFEDWVRSLRFTARVSIGVANTGALAATERADPSARRLYRPARGEHLYSVSRKFYGTPHAWRLIYDRNALAGLTLTGQETLIIPERGGI